MKPIKIKTKIYLILRKLSKLSYININELKDKTSKFIIMNSIQQKKMLH